MISSRVTIDSPLSDIAYNIAINYLLRPFPSKKSPNGLLDYKKIRQEPLNTNDLRPIHGYQNACRVAALVPLIFAFYKKHIHEFKPEFQIKIQNATDDFIKKVQIAGLMRAAGRDKDGGSGVEFSNQAKLECLRYLEYLGIADKDEREYFANALIESDGEKSIPELSLAGCLIADSTMIETFRDIVDYSHKAITIDRFAFFCQLNDFHDFTIDEFIDLCVHQAKVIKSHQGYLFCALQDEKGNPVSEHWPDINDLSIWKTNKNTFLKHQSSLEFNPDCFKICLRDVHEGFKILNQSPMKMDELMSEFLEDQQRKDAMNSPYQFTENLVDFFKPSLNKLMAHTVDGQDYIFRLDWHQIVHYLTHEKKIPHLTFSLLREINSHAIITKENDWYLLCFANQIMAGHFLRLINLLLHKDYFFELRKAKVTEKHNIFRFRLTSKQFAAMMNELQMDMEQLKIIDDLEEFCKNLIRRFHKDPIESVRNTFIAYPILKSFPLGSYARPAIYLAIFLYKLPIVKMLVEEFGAEINIQAKSDFPVFHGMTPLFLACWMKEGADIVTYLIEQGADINLACNNGRTPLSTTAYNGSIDKLKILIATGKVNPDAIMDNGHTALINAVEKGHVEAVKLLLTIPGINVNHRRTNGDFALFIAAKKGNLEIVNLLLAMPCLTLGSLRDQTAARISLDNKHYKVYDAIELEYKIRKLEKLTSKDQAKNLFEVYALNLRKNPDRKLYYQFLQELTRPDKLKNKDLSLTKTEYQYTEARKLWSDVISETFKANQAYIQKHNVKDVLLSRIEKLNRSNMSSEVLYNSILNYLRDGTIVVVSFNASFLKNGLNDFQLLNMWEKDNRNKTGYKYSREMTEKLLFDHLNTDLQNKINTNRNACPRYGSLQAPEDDKTIATTEGYGKSSLVFKEIAKHNMLICPGDTLNHFASTKQSYHPCTIHNMEVMLHQCNGFKLHALIKRILTGKFPDNFDQQINYFEVMLPAVDIFDLQVEMINVSPLEYKIKHDDMKLLKKYGINVKNEKNPYHKITEKFFDAIKNDDVNTVMRLVKRYPSINKYTKSKGVYPVYAAAKHQSLKTMIALSADQPFITPSVHTISIIRHSNLLTFAISRGKTVVVDFFMQSVTDFSEQPFGLTPLHAAAARNQFLIAKSILEKSPASINVTSNLYQKTALQLALIQNAGADLVKLLLDYQADINIKIPDNKNTIQLINKNTSSEVIYVLLKHLVKSQDIDNLNLIDFANSNINLNQLDEYNKSLLHYAIAVNNPQKSFDILLLLLKNKADPNIQNAEEHTPLQHALSRCLALNDVDAIPHVQLLLEYNADIHVKSAENITCFDCFTLAPEMNKIKIELLKLFLYHAISKSDIAGINRVIECRVNISDPLFWKDDIAPLHFAQMQNANPDMVQFLVNLTENINLKSSQGCSVLHLAIKFNNEMDLALILEKQPDLFVYADKEKSPVHMIFSSTNLSTVSIFAGYLKSSIKTLISVLVYCHEQEIAVSDEHLRELIGEYNDGKETIAHKIFNECKLMYESDDHDKKMQSCYILSLINNNERRNDKHDEKHRTIFSRFFRMIPKEHRTIYDEYHRDMKGTALYLAAEYFESMFFFSKKNSDITFFEVPNLVCSDHNYRDKPGDNDKCRIS